MNILEHKNNYIIIKEGNYIKLYSYKSLVLIYNVETKELKEIPYKFNDLYGNTCSHSMTTARHINKFKNYIKDNFKGGCKNEKTNCKN